jgi:hypothetical protein
MEGNIMDKPVNVEERARKMAADVHKFARLFKPDPEFSKQCARGNVDDVSHAVIKHGSGYFFPEPRKK